ncbi:unnamed protein product [Choristocarpus tenellus]
MACPLPRINPCLAVRGNTLYVYGGMLEVGDREFTLDDCWTLELNTRTYWTKVQPGTMDEQAWKGEEEEGSEFDTGGDDEDYDDEDDEDIEMSDEEDEGGDGGHLRRAVVGMSCLDLDGGGGEMSLGVEEEKAPEKVKGSRRKGKGGGGVREEIRKLKELLGVDDPNRTPQAGEVMRDFFDRTKGYWTSEVIARMEAKEGTMEPLSEKELRRDAFALAGERYSELEPSLRRLNRLEAEQKELQAAEAEKKHALRGGRSSGKPIGSRGGRR